MGVLNGRKAKVISHGFAGLDRAAVMANVKRAIDMAPGFGASERAIVVGGVEMGTRELTDGVAFVAEQVAEEGATHVAVCGVKFALEPLRPVYAGGRSCLVTMRDAVDY